VDCLYLHKYREAVLWYREIINQAPGRSIDYEGLANIFLTWKGDGKSARNAIHESRGLVDSTEFKSFILLCDMYDGNYQSVRSYLSIPYFDSASYYRNMAWVSRAEGDSAMARIYADSSLKFAKRKLNQSADSEDAHMELAINYALLGGRDDALQHCSAAMRIMPLTRDAMEGGDPIFAMVQVYTHLGEIDNALSYLDTLMSIPTKWGLGEIMANSDFRPVIRDEGFKEIVDKYADTAQYRLYHEVIGID
jgi:tetratricopeptide (TPR) repeat protein